VAEMQSRSELKVVVVDDSETVRRTAVRLLEQSGYVVFTARDGFEAMSVISDNEPDIIFLDIVMPRLDGYQACSLIRNSRRFGETPVIMLSASDGLFDRARARIAGFSEHLDKPFSKQDLVNIINRHVAAPGSDSQETA